MATQNYIQKPRKCQPCQQCGKWFESTKNSKHCSPACRARAHYNPEKDRQRTRNRKHSGHKERGPFACRHCKAEFYTRRRPGEGEKYCGRACSHKDMAAKPRYTMVHAGQCTECGISFISKLKRALCGADECRKSAARKYSAEIDRARHKADPAKHERKCTQCSVMFCRLPGCSHTLCSDECNRAARTAYKRKTGNCHRRRARHYGVEYEPVNVFKVFERDGWKCTMCGISTPKRLRGKHRHNSPELDHIIPISKGGPHTYGNVQCSCRQCNGDKSDSMAPSQPTLFNNAI